MHKARIDVRASLRKVPRAYNVQQVRTLSIRLGAIDIGEGGTIDDEVAVADLLPHSLLVCDVELRVGQCTDVKPQQGRLPRKKRTDLATCSGYHQVLCRAESPYQGIRPYR